MEKTTEKGLVEKREELMVSSASKTKQILRTAHFLNPIYHASSKPQFPKNPKLLSSSLPPPYSNAQTEPVKVTLRGWRNFSAKWEIWVQYMEGIYHSVWRSAGIYEAIISSTFKFPRDNDVIIGLAKKWCLDTNTFIFPWGEATITLQDMMVLGGYSIFGSPVFSLSPETKQLEEIVDKLRDGKKTPTRWIRTFMCSGSNIEHEAFLSLWLERFVFNDSDPKLQARIFSIAIHLAKGEVFALAPAVLASIYRDLGLLKSTIIDALEFKENENSAHKLAITLCSPLHLVQLWAWERFPAFQPFPNAIQNGHPRSAHWKNLKKVSKFESVRSDLDSEADSFNGQPYEHGLEIHKWLKEKEQWKHLGSKQVLLAYALCLRVSELVGLDCIQHYFPHRVARQFGLDQDIPSDIARTNVLPDIAWSNYIRPFNDIIVFVPSRFSKPDVTKRYSEWWNQTGIDTQDSLKDPIFNPVRRKRSSMARSERAQQAWNEEPLETITQPDAAIETVEIITQEDAAIGTPLTKFEDKTDREARIPSNIGENQNGRRENSDEHTSEIAGLALEGRIAALEEVVAKLKAARGLRN